MTSASKLLGGAAGAAGGGLTVDQVFSTTVYTGTGSSQNIVNGLDMSGEGGLTWLKTRDNAGGGESALIDTARGATKRLRSHSTDSEATEVNGLTAFTSTGFSLGNDSGYNYNTGTFCSWSFRKAPKFFDIQTWDGNGVAGREIAHNLDCEVGMILIKLLNVATRDWVVYHRGVDSSSPENYFLSLNAAGARQSDNDTEKQFNNVAPTSNKFTLGNSSKVNGNYNNLGWKYVAYIFAHETGDDSIVQCGSYTGNGSSTGPVVDVGFQPQFIFYKCATATENWEIIDSVRGVTTNGDDKVLRPNLSDAELNTQRVNFLSNGWQPKDSGGHINGSGRTYIYIAIKAEG